MGWNERSDPDMRTANFKFSCDVYREGVYAARSLNAEWRMKDICSGEKCLCELKYSSVPHIKLYNGFRTLEI